MPTVEHLTALLTELRVDLEELRLNETLPKGRVVDIILDFGTDHDRKAIAHFVLFKLHRQLTLQSRARLGWDEVDDALSELETDE